MPAPVTSTTSLPNVTSTIDKGKPRASHRTRKTRVVRRRGRGRGDIESDEEIEREVATDTESEDDASSVDSATDSDTEPVSDSNSHSHLLTPNTTQSSGDAHSVKVDQTPFFEPSGNWSEMVASEETANGSSDLPVIDFGELNSEAIDKHAVPVRKQPKSQKRAPPPKTVPPPPPTDSDATQQEADADQDDDGAPRPHNGQRTRGGSYVKRPPGQTARQAYQQRLEADPSYVPTVGEFWGHDDRLLDKGLRSLSGWWRGRWRGRGNGRGGFERGRGRGRGGFFGGSDSMRNPAPESESVEQDEFAAETPKVDQQWGHDGFEELKKRDDKRRVLQQQQQQERESQRGSPRPTRGLGPFRGRGVVTGRGRGGFARGGFVSSPTPSSRPDASAMSGRIWYAMKPERVWTKQHEAFLYFDAALKPRPGQGAGFAVRLPSRDATVIRAPPIVPSSSKRHERQVSVAQTVSSEGGEKAFVVRIPKRSGKEKASEDPAVPVEPATTVVEPPLEEVFTVRPGLAPKAAPIVGANSSNSPIVELPAVAPTPPSDEHVSRPSIQIADHIMRETSQLQVKSPVEDKLETPAPEVDEDNAPAKSSEPTRILPQVPPLRTVFSPAPQPSPPYGSPYGYPPSMLPPGIAMNQHGMPYELATGRPVYIHHHHHPSAVYTPPPMMPPPPPFVPGHMHHHSNASGEFYAPSHTPPMSGYMDPMSGAPIFSFPRQSSRVEIRPPGAMEGKSASKMHQHRPSTLRTSAAAFEPTSAVATPAAEEGGAAYHSVDQESGETGEDVTYPSVSALEANGEHTDPGYYGSYQQPYYYPEQYHYPQYYDAGQMPQYEMYNADPHAGSAVYY
ncbi:hypothetical protein CONPUDRAFT_168907 [Coniophora puteana RWD-64-598 SS2]|uniref:Btz domain-containing protein n=1 Tax=Coniophora puteana (strain RWD-64-598) TaxID=741705 RepID=A0A5M3MAU9_CONPW|nr:uncharacterized protein CONPUDRAFT_168907 [Coniophora puteana RWD-64-598 SS2]EIW76349.1 hypothetical protein CONPUDRAFT_168907 [Coniophora puteana RWD-64-598 SS2]